MSMPFFYSRFLLSGFHHHCLLQQIGGFLQPTVYLPLHLGTIFYKGHVCVCTGVGAKSYVSFDHKQALCCSSKALFRNCHVKSLKYLFVGVSEKQCYRNNSDSSWERIVQHVELDWDKQPHGLSSSFGSSAPWVIEPEIHVVCRSEQQTSCRFSRFSSLDGLGRESKRPDSQGGECTARFRFSEHVLNVSCIPGTLRSLSHVPRVR